MTDAEHTLYRVAALAAMLPLTLIAILGFAVLYAFVSAQSVGLRVAFGGFFLWMGVAAVFWNI